MKDKHDWRRAKSARPRHEEEPPDYARHSHRRQQDNKLAQMCRQVQRILALSLSGECHDETLSELAVQNVVPAPDASRLLVQVYFVDSRMAVQLPDLLEKLARATPWLRREVARGIVRKRAPELVFQLVCAQQMEVEDER